MIAHLVCSAFVLGSMPASASRPIRIATCEAIYREAVVQGIAPSLAVAAGWHESRFRPDLRSPAGAVGPLQVRPRFHCPDGKEDGCDLVSAGVSAVGKYLRKYRTIVQAMCHYNQGNTCGTKAVKFGEKVERTEKRVRRIILRFDRPRTS